MFFLVRGLEGPSPEVGTGRAAGMSKHFYRAQQAARTLQVDVGWDRPCQHFYLNIEDAQAPEDQEPLLYAPLYDDRTYGEGRGVLRGGLDVDEVRERLAEFGITPPDGLLEALNNDARLNVGNAGRHW